MTSSGKRSRIEGCLAMRTMMRLRRMTTKKKMTTMMMTILTMTMMMRTTTKLVDRRGRPVESRVADQTNRVVAIQRMTTMTLTQMTMGARRTMMYFSVNCPRTTVVRPYIKANLCNSRT